MRKSEKNVMKKIKIALLFALFCLAVLSIAVLADGEPVEVTQIQAYINEPKIGSVPDSDPVVYATPQDSVDHGTVRWYKLAEENYTGQIEAGDWIPLEEGETFQGGYYYSVDIDIETLAGFTLSESVTGDVNGEPHDDTYFEIYLFDDYGTLSITFEPVTEEPVTSIEALIEEPRPETTPDYIPLYYSEPNLSVSLSYVSWYKLPASDYTGSDNDPWLEMAEDECFDLGYYYYVDMCFVTNEGYVLADNISGTVNEDAVTEDILLWDDTGYLTYVFTPITETVITDISMTVRDPKLDDEPDCDPILSENCRDGLSLRYIRWYKVPVDQYTESEQSDWCLMEDGEAFQSGYYYALAVYFWENDGYLMSGNVSYTVNGMTADRFWGGYISFGQSDYMVVFEPLDAPVAPAENTAPATPKAPPTGDSTPGALYAVLLSASIVTLLGLFVTKKACNRSK